MKTKNLIQVKGIIDDLVNQFAEVININMSADVLKRVLGDAYREGMEKVEVTLDMNFFEERPRLDFLNNYTFDNIKDLNEDIKNKLRQELQRGLMNNENLDQLKERVKKVMQVMDNRARTIARTEANRAENMGRLDAAKQAEGVVKMDKYVNAAIDARTSDICRHMQAAYGTKGKAIPLDQKFKWKNNKGEVLEWDGPPFHPNCRSTIEIEHGPLPKEEIE